MTEKDIKLELAKAAVVSGASKERLDDLLAWVLGEKKHKDLDDISVTELEKFLGMSAVRFRNRCMENDIHTVGQLVRIGSKKFRALRLVGNGLVTRLQDIFEDNYGINDW